MLTAKAMRCPHCCGAIPWGSVPKVFAFHCPHCDACVDVSKSYWRALWLPCLAAGFAFVCQIKVWTFLSQQLGDCLLFGAGVGCVANAVGFLLFMALSRIVPYFISVPLEYYQESSVVTTLRLDRPTYWDQ